MGRLRELMLPPDLKSGQLHLRRDGPLAERLMIVRAAATGVLNHVNGSLIAPSFGSADTVATPFGPAVGALVADGGYQLNNVPLDEQLISENEVTLFALVDYGWVSAGTWGTAVLAVGGSVAGYIQNATGLRITDYGGAPVIDAVFRAPNWGGGIAIYTGVAVPYGKLSTIVSTYKRGGTAYVYLDGRQVASASANDVPIGNNDIGDAYFHFAQVNGTGGAKGLRVFFGGGVRRAWSPDDVARFAGDPVGTMFEPTRIWIPIGAVLGIPRRALTLSGGLISQAQVGAGAKPLVLMPDGSLRLRAGTEGTPVVLDPATQSLRTLAAGEQLEL